MATIVRRGDGQYLAKIRKNGFPFLCKTFPDRRLAEQWTTVTEADMLRSEFIQRKAVEVLTLFKVLDKYAAEKTADKKGEKQELVRIKRMQQHNLAKKPVSNITTECIEAYI
jgi:hypothetical protein